ncbi:hypothetical protein F4677DRAFT_448337 [Hypoxylon crocopeplum]|nr:hypothetical protein F4677DRAFT_448337 [Hypoxylon crocopeplum]
MKGSFTKEVSYDGRNICPILDIVNEGWSTGEQGFSIRSFHGRRAHVPEPLCLENLILEEENFLLRVTKTDLTSPVFDSGLGCFGNSTKLVETGDGELIDLWAGDFREARAAKELFDGQHTFDDYEWIQFQRVSQRNAEDKTEEDLIKFHKAQHESPPQSPKALARPRTSESDRFLVKLDDMESARTTIDGNERTIPTSENNSNGPGHWVLKNFQDWIEETDFVESNASMPIGTRYYRTS